MGGIAAIAGWWLSQQRLAAKPWLEEGVGIDFREESTSIVPPAKIGLGVFLAVVGSLFALFISAYSMRMTLVDWRALPIPQPLWFNTGVLVLSSVGPHCGYMARGRNIIDGGIFGLFSREAPPPTFFLRAPICWPAVRL